ncbi:MAG: hypothetical protein NC245_03640 [Muribaculum sp.]|nr:hypothetical protein [Muribaculum sp.]
MVNRKEKGKEVGEKQVEMFADAIEASANDRQYLNSDNPKLGEDNLVQELSGFSCPKN